MSDDVTTAATIASLRAEVERLTAELQGERDDVAACRSEVNRLSNYAERLLAENVRLSNEAATARERAGVLEREVRAWRHHDDVHECEPMTEYQMRRSIDAHDDACRAAQETDRRNAIDAAKFGGA